MPEFDVTTIVRRLTAITEGARWGGRGPEYNKRENGMIETLQGVAEEHGWRVTYRTWVGKPGRVWEPTRIKPGPAKPCPVCEGSRKYMHQFGPCTEDYEERDCYRCASTQCSLCRGPNPNYVPPADDAG